MTLRALGLLVLGGATAAAAQSLEQRVARAPDGEVRLSYAARPGVYGNGGSIVSWDCARGRCRSRHIESALSDADDEGWGPACDSGPVRVSLAKRGREVTALRVVVGGAGGPRSAVGGGTDLGTVGAPAASYYLLALARAATSRVGERAVFAAALADSVSLWPDLLRIARDVAVPARTRRAAVFWVGQAAEQAATQGLDELAAADTVGREVREAAVFALSQRPREEGVPALIRVVRTHRDPQVRRKAIFWLGQSDDSRALALFEELLTKP